MVLINNKKFEVYKLDTVNSILTRIAASFNSLKDFLYFPAGIPSINDFNETDRNIVVEDIFNIIINDTTDDFEVLYNNIRDKLVQRDINIDQVLSVYISFNSSFANLESIADPDDRKTYLFYLIDKLKNEVNKISKEPIDLSKIYNNNNKNYYEKLLEKTIEDAERKEYEFTEFQKIQSIPYEPFELEIIIFEIELKVKTLSLLEIFNSLKLTDFTPFASCSNFYKIRKEFVPPLEWGINDDKLIIKILQKEEFANSISDYTDFTIRTISDINSPDFNKIKAVLNYNIINNIPKEQIISRFTDILENERDVIGKIEEKGINGVFYFPNQKLNKYIFSDLVLNNREFSTYLNIDETVISQKPTVYIYFYTEELGEIKAYLTEKLVDKKDPSIRQKTNFIDNSYYVRVKVSKAKDTKSIEEFQKILSKMFVIYNSKYDNILEFYERFIPVDEIEINKNTHQSRKVLNVRDKNARNILAPEIFLPNYTSFCGKPPIIISNEDEELEISKGRQVLTFPKDETEGTIPRKYICEYKKFPYPGLRMNTLNNSDKFKYLPCCFENSQEDKPEYRNYYFGDEIVDTAVEQYIITSNKFLKFKQIGRLPKNINKFFELIDEDKNYEYFRIGMNKNKSTFLNCVLYALNLSTDEDENKVINTRKDLATINLASSAKQEMFDYSLDDILNKIRNDNEYFNPNYFIHLLELKYNCNIILFKRDDNNIDGTLSIPRHIKGYFKTNNKFDKCIFIYEHNGIDSDNAKFPQCELICRWNKAGKKDDLEYGFNYDSVITKNALKIYSSYDEFFILHKQINFINFSLNSKILSQTVDFYGKTRLLNIEYKGNKITLFTSPLQPFDVKDNTKFEVYKQSSEIVQDFVKSNNAIKVKVKNNILKCKIGDVKLNIPLKNSDIKSVSEYSSVINEYNKYKKLARYILQYFYWLFSNYLKNNNIEYDDNVIDNFIKDNIIIDTNFKYGNVVKLFIIDNNLFKGNKLVLKNEDSVIRLKYLLKIEMVRDPDKIISYYNRQSIENYYQDISDFDTFSFQIIIHGDDAITKFIQSNLQDEIQYKIYDSILKESIYPYFFRNSLVDNSIYLAQNTLSIKQAFKIYELWKDKKYNYGFNSQYSEKSYGFMFYAYKDNKLIESYYIKGDINTSMKILGFRVTYTIENTEEEIEKTFFTILLPLK